MHAESGADSEPVASEYRKLAEWFVSEVHVGDTGTVSFEECKGRFEALEAFLLGLLSPNFYDPFHELHDIIKQANE